MTVKGSAVELELRASSSSADMFNNMPYCEAIAASTCRATNTLVVLTQITETLRRTLSIGTHLSSTLTIVLKASASKGSVRVKSLALHRVEDWFPWREQFGFRA